jgi:hypothetical protein
MLPNFIRLLQINMPGQLSLSSILSQLPIISMPFLPLADLETYNFHRIRPKGFSVNPKTL